MMVDGHTATDAHDAVSKLEQRLRQAMLDSDVATLDALIHDRLLFVGPDGNLYRKQDDLQLHRSGRQKLHRLDFLESTLECHDNLAVVSVLTDLAGSHGEQAFAGRCRYTRTWRRDSQGWRVVGGSVCHVA